MPFLSRPRAFAATALVAACSAGSAEAATFWVGSGAGCTHATIQAAIDAAAANGVSADDVNVRAGTYVNQSLVITGQNVSISGGWNACGAGAQRTGRSVVSAGPAAGSYGPNRVFRIENPAGNWVTVNLTGLEISDGRDTALDGGGGGIRATGRLLLRLQDSRIVHNTSANVGGGIYLRGESQNSPAALEMLDRTSVVDNQAQSFGGGIRAEFANLNIRSNDTDIVANVAYAGGGIAARRSTVVIGAVGEPLPATGNGAAITINHATRGGGVYVDDQTLFEARELRLYGNTAASMGGGLYATGGAQVLFARDYPNAFALRCTGPNCSRIEANQAGDGCPGTSGDGGGVYLDGASGYFNQVEFVGNCAFGSPAIMAWGTRLYLEGALFARNRLTWRSPTSSTGRQVVTLGNRGGDPPRTADIAFTTFADNVEVKSDNTTEPASPISMLYAGGDWTTRMRGTIATGSIPAASGGIDALGPCNRSNVFTSWFANAAGGDYRPNPAGGLVDACAREDITFEYSDPFLVPRCQDHTRPNQGGTCDLGAYELPGNIPDDRIFASGFD